MRALGSPPPLRVRPSPPVWALNGDPARRRQGAALAKPAGPPPEGRVAPARRTAPLPSAVTEASTDPAWQHPPRETTAEVGRAGKAPAGSSEAASWGARLGAAGVDALVVLAAVLAAAGLSIAAFGPARLVPYARHGFDYVLDGLVLERQLGLILLALAVAIGGAYATVAHALGGATFGKRLFGLRVVGPGGAPVALSQSFARTLVACLTGAPAGLGFAFALFDRQHAALHDRLVGTRVVRHPPAAPP